MVWQGFLSFYAATAGVYALLNFRQWVVYIHLFPAFVPDPVKTRSPLFGPTNPQFNADVTFRVAMVMVS